MSYNAYKVITFKHYNYPSFNIHDDKVLEYISDYLGDSDGSTIITIPIKILIEMSKDNDIDREDRDKIKLDIAEAESENIDFVLYYCC